MHDSKLLKTLRSYGCSVFGFLPKEPLINVGGEELARQIWPKKRSLYRINEHFEVKFNNARSSKLVNQRFLKSFYGVAIIALISGCSESGDVKLDDPAVVYSSYCYACHDYGAINAPKLDDLAFWSAAQTDAALQERFYQSTLQGIRAMPAKGTCLVCTEQQLRKTVDWMIQQNQQPKKS